jgi:hypothetical protein
MRLVRWSYSITAGREAAYLTAFWETDKMAKKRRQEPAPKASNEILPRRPTTGQEADLAVSVSKVKDGAITVDEIRWARRLVADAFGGDFGNAAAVLKHLRNLEDIERAIEAINYAGEFAEPLHGSGSKKSADEGAISEKPFDIENG